MNILENLYIYLESIVYIINCAGVLLLTYYIGLPAVFIIYLKKRGNKELRIIVKLSGQRCKKKTANTCTITIVHDINTFYVKELADLSEKSNVTHCNKDGSL